MNPHLLILVLGVVCFTIGAFNKLAAAIGPNINWTNAGLAFVTLSLII